MGGPPKTKRLGSIDEYLAGLREKIEALRTRTSLSALSALKLETDKVRLYFINRAIEIGEACFRIRDLGLPISILSRVLCEDFFLLFWATLSEQNAAEFTKLASSELTRMLRVLLTENRGKIRHKSTGEDVTNSVLPKLNDFIVPKKNVAEIAKESGLSKVYDLLYRSHSLEVHANSFGFPISEGDDAVAAVLSSLNGILKVTILVVDRPAGTITAEEILRSLGIEKLGGK